MTSSTSKIGRDLLAAERLVRGVVAQFGLALRGSRPPRTPAINLSNFSILPSRKLSTGRMRMTSSSALASTCVAVLEREVGGDVVARLGRPVVAAPAGRGGPACFCSVWSTSASVNSRTGFSIFRPFHLRQVELGPHFDVELEGQRPFVGQFDRLEVEIRLADRRELLSSLTCARLSINSSLFTFSAMSLRKRVSTSLPRRMARPEARHLRRGHQLAELLVEVAVDVLARDRDRDVPLAGAAAVDLHLEGQLLRLLVLRLGVVDVVRLVGRGGEIFGIGVLVVRHDASPWMEDV